MIIKGLKNKGLLLKSSTAMRNAVQCSGDSILISKYDEWLDLNKEIAQKNSQGEDAKELQDIADSLEIILVNRSQEFSDFKQSQQLGWKDLRTRPLQSSLFVSAHLIFGGDMN